MNANNTLTICQEKNENSENISKLSAKFLNNADQEANPMFFDPSNNMSRDQHQITQFYQESGRKKLPALRKFLQNLVKSRPDSKILFFAHHKQVLDGMMHLFPQEMSMRIDGTTSTAQRHINVQKFQKDKK